MKRQRQSEIVKGTNSPNIEGKLIKNTESLMKFIQTLNKLGNSKGTLTQ